MKANSKTNEQSFSEHYEEREMRRNVKYSSLFVILFGFVLIFSFGLEAICSVGIKEYLCYIVSIAGLLLIITSTLMPLIYVNLIKKMQTIMNKLGKYIISIAIIPVYLLMCIVSLPFIKKNQKKYEYIKWNDIGTAGETHYKECNENVFSLSLSKTHVFIGNLFSIFANNGQYFIYPVLILLLLIGLVFFFVSTSSIFVFVYTLF